MTFAIAMATVLAWGVWLVPAQRVRPRHVLAEVFFVTAGNVLVAAPLAWQMPGTPALSGRQFATIALGGAVWTLSGWCAFGATQRLGIARAAGLWSPLNILVSLAWGGLLFGEFTRATAAQLGWTVVAVAGLMAGLLIIIRAGANAFGGADRAGWLLALCAGVLWGSYFLPIRMAGASSWAASFPMALGMFGSALAVASWRRAPLLAAGWRGGLIQTSSGLLWAVGNYGSLAMMERWGTGRGFALAQLCLVVNGLVGIYGLRTPQPGSRAARQVLAGCALATAAGVLLGLAS
jgi:glucose uptake protein